MARLYFLACVILTPWLVSGQTIYGLYGKMLQLKPGTTGRIDNMLWKHNGNKVVEFSGQEEEVYSQFQNRVTLDWISAELNITDLRYDDSGEYKLEVLIDNKLKNFKYKVMVIDKISKPTISCDINNNTSGTRGTQATLTCSADSKASVTYEWASDGKILPGPKLKISLGEEDDDKTHTCTVTDPLGSEYTTFTAKDCYPAKTSSALLAPAIAVPLIVILLAVVLGLYFLKQKKKACFADMEGKDSEAPQEDEHKSLINRTPTIPSTQRLNCPNQGHGMDHSGEVEKGEGFVQKRRKMFDQNTANLNKEKRVPPPIAKKPTVQRTRVPECEPSDTEKANEPEPAEENTDEDNQTQSPHSPLPEKPARLDPVNLPSSDKDDAEADEEEKVLEIEPLDTEKANEPEPAGGSGNREDAQADVESSTAPKQPDKDKTTCLPTPPKKPARLDPVNQPVNNNDADAHESGAPPVKVPECEPSVSEKANEPEPVGVSDQSEDIQDEAESSIALQRGYVMRVSKRFQTHFQKDSRAAVRLDHNEDTKDDVVPPTVSENPEKHIDNDKKTCLPSSPKKSSHLDSLNQPGNNKENAEKDESTGPPENKVPECEPSDTEKANELVTQADVESSTAPQTKGYVMRVSKRLQTHFQSDSQAAVGLDHIEDTKDDVVPPTVSENPEKHVDDDKKTCPPSSPKKSSHLDSLNQPGNNKENAEKDESTGPPENKVPECEPSDTETANELDTQADVESSTAPPTKANLKEEKRVPPPIAKKPIVPLLNNNKNDAEAHEPIKEPPENKVPECEPSDTEKANEPDTQADVESSTAPPTKESDNSHPANDSPPVPKPRSRSTTGSDNTAAEHK